MTSWHRCRKSAWHDTFLSSMIETATTITTRDGHMPTWIVHPDASGPFPLVIFWMDALGVREELRDMCRRIATVGYGVYLANLYYRDGGPSFDPANLASGQLDPAMLALNDALSMPMTVSDCAALLEHAQHNQAICFPAAVIGYCMGGQAILELARENADLAVVASFHGILDSGRKAPLGGPVGPRILVCHGDADALVPRAQVVAFWQEMDAAGTNWHFHSYSGVGHGFTNPNPPPAGGPTSYDASADRQSWAAMLGLFAEVFDQA